MHVDQYFCDHCGKPIDRKDVGIMVSSTDEVFKTDLCTACQRELKKMVHEFCKKEYKEE